MQPVLFIDSTRNLVWAQTIGGHHPQMPHKHFLSCAPNLQFDHRQGRRGPAAVWGPVARKRDADQLAEIFQQVVQLFV